MAYKYNVFLDELDIYRSNKELDARYLKLDQTLSQTVTNGLPQFNEGIIIRKNKPLYYDGN